MCDPLPWHLIYGHYLMSLLPLDQRHHVGEVWARLEQGESRYAPDKYFSYNSFLTFTFDIKNLFNVIKHTLLESSVYVKYGPKILNGQYALKKEMFMWSDLTLTLELRSLFKITAYHKDTTILWEKYGPDLTNGEVDMPRTRTLCIIVLWPQHWI